MPSFNKEEFQRNFQNLLIRERVSEKAQAYYVRHLEHWGRALRGRTEEAAMDVFLDGYFRNLVHTTSMAPFAVVQALEGVRLAHDVLLKDDWAARVDWEGLRVELGREPDELPGEVMVIQISRQTVDP